ncbi:MAG: Fic family protein [bacterium]
MNDTILNIRQKQILELINKGGGISRLEVVETLPKQYRASVPTISRDLNLLLKSKLVAVSGKGPNTKYFPIDNNLLLRYVDIEEYFLIDPDKRENINTKFNNKIFGDLSCIFSALEIRDINKENKSFSERSKSLSKDIYLKELERFVIEFSWKSSKIEGNTYSLLDTEALIKQKMEALGHSKEEAVMILNHKSAFETIMENIKDFRKISFSQITQLHNILVKDLNVETGIRSQAVGITGTKYVPLDNKWQIKEAIETLIATINKSKYPLEKALLAITMISYIQPFADGNKRTARMLANAILVAHDFYPLSYRSVDESYYKKALIIFYEQNSLYPLKEIIKDQYLFAINTYFK